MTDTKTTPSTPPTLTVCFGLLTPLAMFFGYGYWTHKYLINDVPFLALSSVALCVLIPVVFGLIFRLDRSAISRHVAWAVCASLFWNTIMIGICLMTVQVNYQSVTTLAEFAQTDFAWVDAGNTGKVNSQQLQAILSADAAFNNRISSIEMAKQQIDNAANSVVAIDQAVKELDAAFANDEHERERTQKALEGLAPATEKIATAKQQLTEVEDILKSQILPSDRAGRLAVVSNLSCAAGKEIGHGADGTTICEVTRDDLNNFTHKLDQEYPFWSWILHKVNAI
jgi:hypothetical protein